MIRYQYEVLVANANETDWLVKLDHMLNEKGQEGWKLVSVSHSMSRVLAFMMREKS